MKHLLYIVLLPILLLSCKKQIYHSFTDEERAYMVYELGEEIKLEDENTGDIITMEVTNKSVRFVEDFGPKLGPSRKEHFMEEGRIDFSGSGYEGYIYIYKDKIDQFSLDLRFKHHPDFGFIVSGRSGPTTVENSMTINGITYKNVHNFDSYIYFSQEYGFVQLLDTANGKHYTRVP